MTETDELSKPGRQPDPSGPATCQELTYSAYLRLPQLLDLQVPVAAEVHDERLFISVHQVQELWFAQLLAELTVARDHMLDGNPRPSVAGLARGLAIGHALVSGLRPLRTMRPAAFRAFRTRLGTASGAQSAQFHEIEALSGAEWARGTRLPRGLTAEEQTRLRRRRSEPSLWDAFLALLRKGGFETDTAEGRSNAYAQLAAGHVPEAPATLADLSELAEALLRHDEIWTEWRAGHVLMVERQIGSLPGTGGTTGLSQLRAGMHRRFYPELWHPAAPTPVPVPASEVSEAPD
jgi:tryptophan 2,3-dioxygenase